MSEYRLPEEYLSISEKNVALIPVPYDGTSTWGKGADQGPGAFLNALEALELYDIETDSEVYLQGVELAPAIVNQDSPEAMVEAVHAACRHHLKQGQRVTLVGGEHSISIGSIRAHREHYPNLTVLQLDAHADLRPSYLGSRCNHACAVHEASQTCNLIQVGIRSMDRSEWQWAQRDRIFFAHEIRDRSDWIPRALNLMTDPVFITIDLDGFDPSIVPATGTPEPGGLGWYQVLDLVRTVCAARHVVGFDITELCPIPGHRASENLAAKLWYKLLSYMFAGLDRPHPVD